MLRNGRIPFEDVHCPLCDLIVGGFGLKGIADLDLVRDRVHATHALGRSDRVDFLIVALDVSAQGYNSIFDRNSDMFGVEAWIELQLVEHILAKDLVVHIAPPLAAKKN